MYFQSMLQHCFFILCGLCLLHRAEAQSTEHLNLNKKGVAIKGYDPVSYFRSKGPTPGHSTLSRTHQNAIYYFSSKKNRETFIVDPKKYTPQYGGWCAYAMGKEGEKVSIHPKSFKIINGKLYLFYKNTFYHTFEDWNEDEERLHKQADKNWHTIIK